MYRIPLFAAIVISVCVLIPVAMRGNQSSPLPTPPELRAHNHASSLTLHAVADSNGRDVFAFTCRSGASRHRHPQRGSQVFEAAEAFTPEQLAELYDVNVLSTQRINRAVLPILRK